MEYIVVSVIDDFTIAINAGINDNVQNGDIFTIFGESNESIINPKTGEDLGFLKCPKGKGIVISVQETMSVLQSCDFEIIKRKEKIPVSPYDKLMNPMAQSTIMEYDDKKRRPFKNVQIGDTAEL